MRVLQGVTGQAGQPGTLAEGLRQIGIEAESVSVQDHAFGYESDRRISVSAIRSISDLDTMVGALAREFDVFHFHARSFFTLWPELDSPSLQDIFLLKMHGAKVYFHFRGQEIRDSQLFRNRNPFHYVDEPSGYLFNKIPDRSKEILRNTVECLCDGVFVVDEELRTYAPNAEIVPRALDGRGWGYVGVGDTDVPVVVHAPSRRGVKGTQYVLQAAEELRREGLRFELRLVENLSHNEAREIYRRADVVVDQLRIGWYGVLAVEALALGKPVISYIREDLWRERGGDLPVLNANPTTIRDVMRLAIEDGALRKRLSAEARAYFDRVHDCRVVAAHLADIYRRPVSRPNLSGYAALLDHQQRLLSRSTELGLPALRRGNVARRLMAEFFRIREAEGNMAALGAFKSWVRRIIR